MRKTLQLWLVFALLVPLVLPLGFGSVSITNAQSQVEPDPGAVNPTIGLPDFDVRQELESARSQIVPESAEIQARRDAIRDFRAKLDPIAEAGLRFEIGEAGVPRMFFSYNAPLSPASAGSPDSIAREFLTENSEIFGLTRREVRRLKLENQDQDGEIAFLNYEQTIGGVTVFHGHVQVAVRDSGEVLSVNEGMVIPNGKVNTTPRLAEDQALAMAFEHVGRDAAPALKVLESRSSRGDRAVYENPLGENYDNIISDLRIMRIGDKGVLAWHAYLDVGPSEWYEVCVDARTGELLFRSNLYDDVAQGTVFAENPGAVARTLESFVGDTAINTSTGWMGTSVVSTGNNVDAYLDTNADNVADATNTTGLSNGHATAANQDFTFPFSTGLDPRTQRPSVVTNLFFFVNLAHDYTYRLGFTESAGNFQTNNFGRGGTGNDPVRAEAQDGSGVNNANFATPPDGSRPRMQQFIFTLGTTSLADDRDSSQDGDVVLHEFGHGVSNRLVGGPSNTSCLRGTQAGAMGEGWSDYIACSFFNDGRVGEYVANNTTRGIRRAAYSIPANQIHDSYADLGNQGFEVHRDGEIWAATLFDLRNALGQALADRLVVEGMKFTTCSPSFLNARDGILQADQNLNGGANRCAIWAVFARHGMGFSATGNNGTTHNAATDVPPDCAGGGGGGGGGGEPVVLINEGAENGATGWTASNQGSPWSIQTTTASHTGARRFRTNASTTNYANNTNSSLISPTFSLTGKTSATLTYFVKFRTQANLDFFRVEVSTNGGSTWTTLSAQSGASAGFSAWAPQVTVNLTPFVGNGSVRLRFRLTSDPSVTDFGVALDDIVVSAQ